MDVTLARVPIEPMEADRLREWYAELHDREDEVVETLQHEGVYTESVFIRESDGVEYLYVYMEAKDAEAVSAAGDKETHDIDGEHHDVLDTCLAGEWVELETVGHYPNPGLR